MVKEYRFDVLTFIFCCLENGINQEIMRDSFETWVLKVINKPIYFEEDSEVSYNTGYLIHKDWCREVK